MDCKVCGRNITNENANFCEYCGASFRDYVPVKQESNSYEQSQQTSNATANAEVEKPISFVNWMGTMLLPFIPMVGIFIYLVMMFVWAFGSDTPKSKKNWARASLIMMILGIVILVFMLTPIMMDVLNSGVSMEEYLKQLEKVYY